MSPTSTPSTPRCGLAGLALTALLLQACAAVDVQLKPDSGFTRASSFALAVEEDASATRARLTARLIGRGFNVIAALPTASPSDGEAGGALPSRLRRMSNALPDDARQTGFASRYVLDVDHAYEDAGRFGMRKLVYQRFSARMVDRVTGQVVLSAVLDGGDRIDATLDDLVDALDAQLD